MVDAKLASTSIGCDGKNVSRYWMNNWIVRH